jgi:hypothetical protein
MAVVNIPEALREFLAAGRQLAYNTAVCQNTVGEIEFFPLSDLWVKDFPTRPQDEEGYLRDDDPHHDDGEYLVPGVDLVCWSTTAAPEGLLVWFPAEGRFGTWAQIPHVIYTFPQATWQDIEADPVRYLTDAFYPEERMEMLKPWPKYPFRKGPTGRARARRCT